MTDELIKVEGMEENVRHCSIYLSYIDYIFVHFMRLNNCSLSGQDN